MTDIYWQGFNFGLTLGIQIFLGALVMNAVMTWIKKI